MQFWKYHALGNDYLVLEPPTDPEALTPSGVRLLCQRHFGIGSDGILLGLYPPASSGYAALAAACGEACPGDCIGGVRILNPDGSEAEKSGNGLRIFARFLHDTGRVDATPFRLLTLGGVVRCCCLDGGQRVRVEMGPVSFDSARIPLTGPRREVIDESVELNGRVLTYCAATVGNPHCVVLCDQISEPLACELGPALETDPRFPNRTNVQFMKVIDGHRVAIEIWERGAGYTLASGSSASAAAAVACRLGVCSSPITVCMPGGDLLVEIDSATWHVTQTGPVSGVAAGVISEDLAAASGLAG